MEIDKNQDALDQDSRVGGYGGSDSARIPEGDQQEQTGEASAAGREDPGDSPVDADEALGNRTGGYGGWGNDQDEGQVGNG